MMGTILPEKGFLKNYDDPWLKTLVNLPMRKEMHLSKLGGEHKLRTRASHVGSPGEKKEAGAGNERAVLVPICFTSIKGTRVRDQVIGLQDN